MKNNTSKGDPLDRPEETKVNGRRLNGEGSINKVVGRKLFRGRIQVEGKSFQRYGKTRGEVRDKRREAKKLAKGGVDPNLKETVEQYLMQWHDKD